MTESPHLRFEQRGPVAWLTLDRPQRRNALSAEAIELFGRHLDHIEATPDIRVVCITGAGDRAFCSGADLVATVGQGSGQAAMRAYAALLVRLQQLPLPLVARVNGACLGGGLGLLLSCDLAFAREGAKIGTPELDVGLFPMMIAPLILRAMPRAQALEMIYLARMLPAEEAWALGLVTSVLAADELDRVVQNVLDALACKPPLAMAAGRRALATVQDMELEPALEHLSGQLMELMKTEDAREGLMAFVQKRKPTWMGR